MGESVEALRARYPEAQTYQFGDSVALSRELLALVRSGREVATRAAMADIEWGVDPMPVVGRCDIALGADGEPAVVTRTLELREVRFRDMTEEMALMEGEDETLAGWRAGHERFYRRAGIFDPDMVLIWERFELVEDLAPGAGG